LLPQGRPATTDFWMSSGSQEAMAFLHRFRESAQVMKQALSLVPHFHIFSLPAILGSANICAASIDGCDTCAPAPGRYCAPDPDGPGPLTGADVVNEDLRRLCLVNMSAQQQREDADAWHGEVFWDYTEQFSKTCSLKVNNRTTNETRFGYACSAAVMAKVGIPVEQVNDCINQTFATRLDEQLFSVAWSPQALRVNGWRYTGQLDPKQVLQEVCSSFPERPKQCKDLLDTATLSVKAVKKIVRRARRRNLGSVLAIAAVAMVALSFAISAYRRHMNSTLRKAVREEVMLEVQAQVADYVTMEDPTGDKTQHLSPKA